MEAGLEIGERRRMKRIKGKFPNCPWNVGREWEDPPEIHRELIPAFPNPTLSHYPTGGFSLG